MIFQEYKVELHAHTDYDPQDGVEYSSHELIEKASRLGYQVLAITCHNALQWSEELRTFAVERGISLIPGVEATIEGLHVLIYGLQHFRPPMTFAQLKALRQSHPEVLTIAPHPFFPGRTCLGDKLVQHRDCFDAVEYSHFYTHHLNFNQRAVKYAGILGKPVVGTSDCHLLEQMDTTYSVVFATANDFQSIAASIRQRRVQIVTRPLSFFKMIKIFLKMLKISATGRRSGLSSFWEDSRKYWPQAEE
jgi:predicted metal-dependent phosphoesterase TrpH